MGDEAGEELAEDRLATLLLRLLDPKVLRTERASMKGALAQYRFLPKVANRVVARLRSLASGESRPSRQQKLSVAAERIEAGHRQAEEARDRLICANMRLVVWLAKRKVDHGLLLGDLVQEGNIGLMRAADKFDHRRGVRFSTYATWWIRQSVNRALSDQSRTIRLPVHLLEVKHKLDGVRRRFVNQHRREASADELALATGVPLSRIRQVLEAPKQPLSMDAPLTSDGETRLGDIVADPAALSPIEGIAGGRVREAVREMLTELTPREQLVLKMRFGIDHPDGITLQEVGKKLAVSRERIRQIESQALSKLRNRAGSEDLASYL
jgi:RNA polymerase primary sigma factor